MSDALATLE
ncbi:hypothetical protein AGR7C_Lc130017 [Agrobacterium deltaense Zutra 3/1]|uniref:Uncharacterized protein n=1 Tax=Agrobacterium deltaense Zutra 3/1 TaxID=1183427 RepID=A0A1S7R6Q4_9HYPH|nr:hypothetical protein AGR7C_Lc130017 [Agrobacterium deltaense Zutra 3/1]